MTTKTITERDVHDLLVKKVDWAVGDLRRGWKPDQVESTAMVWVSSEVLDDRGVPINDWIVLELPENRGTWSAVLEKLVTRTNAFALAVFDRHDAGISVRFESPLGCQKWELKKERHGDVTVMSAPVVTPNNEDTTGLLWNPH